MCELCGRPHLTRRGIMFGGAALASMAVMPAAFAAETTDAPANNDISPDEAAKRLVEGNQRYVSGDLTNKDFSAGRAARAVGQAPFAAVVSCSDSRVAPELLFDQGPGDLFIVRVAGNFVNEDGLASLEYGVAVLGTKAIMVLGHSSCGAIEATIKAVKDGTKFPGHLPALVHALTPAVKAAMKSKPDDLLNEAIAENVRLTVAYLSSAKPILSEAISKGKLKVVGGVYEIATGKVNPV